MMSDVSYSEGEQVGHPGIFYNALVVIHPYIGHTVA